MRTVHYVVLKMHVNETENVNILVHDLVQGHDEIEPVVTLGAIGCPEEDQNSHISWYHGDRKEKF